MIENDISIGSNSIRNFYILNVNWLHASFVLFEP